VTWSFERPDFLSFGGAAAAVAASVLSDGPIGLHWRPDVALIFRACGEPGCDLRGIQTSCAVDASACWGWAGRKHTLPRGKMKPHGHIGGPIVTAQGWLELDAKYWIPNDGTAAPDIGDIPTFGPLHRLDLTHHVELTMAYADGLITTAHGGDSPNYGELVQAGIQNDKDAIKRANGTVMRMGAGPKAMTGISGWFSAAMVAEAEGL